MDFGDYLKNLRTQRGISQQKLAEMMYVNRSSVARWESGSRLPDAVMIARLADVLNTDVKELLAASEADEEIPNIIVVDDERIVLKGEVGILEDTFPQASITGFTKASEALSFISGNRIAIAFLDIELGQHSGIKLCNEILSVRPDTNIIFLTAFPDYSLDAWGTGACGFIVKPLTRENISDSLSRLRNPIRGEGSNLRCPEQ